MSDARKINVIIKMNGEYKTYYMYEFDLKMLLECNEISWPDFSKDELAFVVCEQAHYDYDGMLEKVTMLMLTTLERKTLVEPFSQEN